MSALAVIHIAAKELGLDEESLRALYARETGKRSLREMTAGERGRVIEALKRAGFAGAKAGPKGASGARKPGLGGIYAPVLQALWISAWNLGVVRSRHDKALIAFVARQTQIAHPNWLRDGVDASKAIEALKAWIRREAGDDGLFRVGKDLPEWLRDPKVQVIRRQWERQLVAQGASRTMNSRHLHGMAIDLWPIDPVTGKGSWSWAHYDALGPAVKRAAEAEGVPVTWGGDWTTFRDGPHFELPHALYPDGTVFPAVDPATVRPRAGGAGGFETAAEAQAPAPEERRYLLVIPADGPPIVKDLP